MKVNIIKQHICSVTVTYNSSKHIKKMLLSLIRCDLLNKIIIVENNSPDANKTKTIIDSIKKKYPFKKILFINAKKNLGFGKACNIGAKHCNSKYLLFINPDTKVHKNSINTLLSHMLLTDSQLAGGKMINQSKKVHETFVREPNLTISLFEFSNLGKFFNTKIGHNKFYYHDVNHKMNEDFVVDAVSGGYLLIEKSIFDALRGFDEDFFMYLEDVDLGIRAKYAGYKTIYCPHSKIEHEGGASSQNKDRILHSAWFSSRRIYSLKHLSFLSNLIIQPIYWIDEWLLKLIKSI